MNIGRGLLFKHWWLLCAAFVMSLASVAQAAPSLALGSAKGAAGQVVSVPLTFTNDGSVAGLQFDVQFDATQLNAGATTAGSALTATGHGIASSVVSANTLRVVVKPSLGNGSISSAELASLSWGISAVAPGGVQPLTITNVVLAKSDSSAVAVGTLTPGAITINSAPVAGNDSVTTSEDTSISATLTASDADGDALHFTLLGTPAHGTVTLTNPATGAFTYTPNPNANGSDSFTFKVSDGWSDSNVATMTLNVTPVNDAPVLSAIGDQSVNEGAVKSVALGASDVDSGSVLRFSATGLPAFATLTESGNGTASLNVAPGYSDAGSFNITVTVTDDGVPVLSESKGFTLTVINVNSPPTANAGVDQMVNGGTSVTLPGSGSDIDGTVASHTWSQVGGTAVTLSGANTATASFSAPNVTGTTLFTFQLTVADNNGATGSDQVVITVKPAGKSDLLISAIGAPLSAAAGSAIAISNTVTNSGTADAEGNFDVGLYLLPQPVLLSTAFESGTLEGWSTLRRGSISVVSDAADGWVLKKSSNIDPNGGQALLASNTSDFELTLFTKRLNSKRDNTNRYSLTDANGNGYGAYLDFATGTLVVERRTAWNVTALASTPVSGGAVIGQWYTLQFAKIGSQLVAKAYPGKVVPAQATAIASVSASDTTYTNFTQVNLNGGFDYYSDNIRVLKLLNAWPTDGSEILLGKRVVYGLALGGASSDNASWTIPAGTAARTYGIAVKADMYSVITEGNESNNLLLGNRQFVIAP